MTRVAAEVRSNALEPLAPMVRAAVIAIANEATGGALKNFNNPRVGAVDRLLTVLRALPVNVRGAVTAYYRGEVDFETACTRFKVPKQALAAAKDLLWRTFNRQGGLKAKPPHNIRQRQKEAAAQAS